jgi:GNAT superfamily N-acetyltransferase
MTDESFLNNLVIRQASQKDAKAMMGLIKELAHYEKSPDEVTVSEESFVEAGFGTRPIWWAYVAVVDEEVIGFALYYLRYSTWKGPRMYLEDILVTEKWRNKGIGKLLFEQLIITAKERKLNGMVWQVLDWNEDAIRFYRKYKGVKFDNGWINCSIEF